MEVSKKSLLIIIVTLMIAKRRDLSTFWGACGNFWERNWNALLDVTGDDPVNVWGFGIQSVVIITYCVGAAAFTVLDFIKLPYFLNRYKIQQKTEPVDMKKFYKVLLNVCINLVIVNGILAYPQTWLMNLRGYPKVREVPTFHNLLGHVVILLFILEAVYYYGHRTLHFKLFYKHIHKQHHEWKSPIAVTAGYAHPIEFIVHNMLPIYAGIFIVGTHAITAWLWYVITVLGMISTHCGYHFPFTPSGEFHDFHHSKFTENFGIMGWLDNIHKTNEKFKKTIQYQRDAMQFHFTPPKVLYPDQTN